MIIILGTNVPVGTTVFLNGMNMNAIEKIAYVINHTHGKCVVGAFDKILHEGYNWTGPRSVLTFILHKSIFLEFVHQVT